MALDNLKKRFVEWQKQNISKATVVKQLEKYAQKQQEFHQAMEDGYQPSDIDWGTNAIGMWNQYQLDKQFIKGIQGAVDHFTQKQ